MVVLLRDIRYSIRQVYKSPGFILTSVFTLALGISAIVGVFTVLNQVLLRMLPAERPEQLVRFEWSGDFSGSSNCFGGDMHDFFSYPMYKDLRDHNQVFSGMLAADRANVGVSWQNQTETEGAEVVSGNYFQVLGIDPAVGRLLTPVDDTGGGANLVAVLSYDYWKTRFAGSREAVGKTMLINGHSFTILGVAPQGFHSVIGGFKPSVFLPVSAADIAMPDMASLKNITNRQSVWLTLVARLKPSVTRPQAEASLAPLWHALREHELILYGSTSERFKKGFLDNSHLSVKDDSKGFSPERNELRTPLLILMGMTCLVMVMCITNVAILLLLRSAGRTHEMAVRYAMGAKWSRIGSQLLVEGGLLGLGGCAAGLIAVPAVARLFVRLLTNAVPSEEPYSVAISLHALFVALVTSVFASLLFSLVPILRFVHPDVMNDLRQSRTTLSWGAQRLRKFAIGAQIAISIVLLGGAGLFMRTMENLRHQPLGFEPRSLVTFTLDPAISGFGEDRAAQIVTNVLDAVRRIPGVADAAATTDPELAGGEEVSYFLVSGHRPTKGENMNLEDPWITPAYFATLKQPLFAGREFALSDVQGAPDVAIVNLAFAQRFYGSPQDTLGHLVAVGGPEGMGAKTIIIGVVGNVRHYDLHTELGPAVYRPYLQQKHPGAVQIYVRSAVAPEAIEASIRETVHRLDPILVVDGLRTMQAQVERSAPTEVAIAVLTTSFAGLAAMLVAIGLYGVLAYSVEQRTREIGVRLALGAPWWSLITLVIRETVIIATIAAALALPSVVMLGRLCRTYLYGVSAFDPVSLVVAVASTIAVVTLSAALPARRACSIEPTKALRAE